MKENGRKQGAVSPCAACKLLRRRCAPDCVFAPHFPAEEPQKFANVHRVFGASNVNKMLQELPMHQRGDAVSSMVYEANARVRDPVYGCVGAISSLQQQIDVLQAQLALAQAEVVHMRMRQYGNNNNTIPHHHHHHHNHHQDTTPENSPPSKIISSHHHHHHHHQSKSLFSMDMCLDQPNMEDSLWSC